MASGAAPTVLKFLRKHLLPYGLVPVQGGGAGGKSEERAAEGKNEKLQPGSVLCISLMSGDLDLTASGTVTEVRDDKIYGFGHSFMGMGEADYPMSVGEALFVYPSRYISFRVGAPLKEVGRLTWDEMAGVVGRVGPKRSRMVPVEVEVLGPDDKSRRVYKYRVIHHRLLSSSLVTTAFINSLFARSALPQDVTLRYSVRIEIDGHEPVVLENISSGPSSMFMIMIQIMGTTSLLMNNAIEPLRLKAVQTKIEVIPKTRLSIIRSVRALKNAVRPGQSMPVEIILRTYRGPDVRLVEDVPIPADLPSGTYRLTVCGGSENLREEMRELPGRYNPRTISDMLWILRRDEPMDNLFFRLHLPAGKGLAIEGSELPNLPGSISAIIGQTGREVSSIRQPRVTRKQLDMLLSGFRNVMIPVDDRAPRN
jgi:hypothetical protein